MSSTTNNLTGMCNHAVSSDYAFLDHMIIHHKVAVDMARELQAKSGNTVILEYLRDLIRQQDYEITVMGSINRRGVPQLFSKSPTYDKYTDSSKYEYYGIVGYGAGCPEHMFQPMKYRQITSPGMEAEFLEHMIVHHQIAVDICRVMIQTTSSPHIMSLCYDIIRTQEHEISKMRDLLSWVAGWQFCKK